MRYAGTGMARSHVAIAVAFVLTTVVAYQVGQRRASRLMEPAPHGEDAGASEDEADPSPTAGEAEAEAAPTAAAPEADAASPIIILPPPPPPRPPRDILIVGKRPWERFAEQAAAAEPEPPPPVVVVEPAVPAPVPAAPLNPEVTHSSFDDQDTIDRHPVPDRGPLTRSRFDDQATIDHHPVP